MEETSGTNHDVACEFAMNRVEFISSKSKLSQRKDVAIVQPMHVQIDRQSLGSGSFSRVHLVRMINSPNFKKKNEYYALKCLSSIRSLVLDGSFESAITDLALEADILSRLYHPNIIELHGVMSGCLSESFKDSNVGYFLILDLLKDTLDSRLRHWRLEGRRQELLGNSQSKHEAIRSRVQSVAVGVAKGMKYLHQNNVILRDLKPENIGFDQYGTVKLFDFGFAREIHTCPKNDMAGSLRYMAPEMMSILDTRCHSSLDITLASDIYSFGLVLWELCTLQTPYRQAHTPKQLLEMVVHRRWRPSVRSIPSKLLRNVIAQCWSPDPQSRPTFTEIHNELELKSVPREQRRKLQRSCKIVDVSALSLIF